ncbi:copper chaperone PCu(A)C [uncultured Sulfitobacter sp.]|uniref:copper chaperone PCu(A)C n=1 Tax=uncultured Sulfitobacter sp. TaxID=191468 RepID=UPI00262DDF65|nr:copper chaperone PCu(A)C [uncultured Sulfitobacter sp.]
MKFLIHTAFAALLTTTAAFAHDYTVADLIVAHPKTFEKAQAVNVAGGYLSIENTGSTADMLLEVQVADIPRIELHLSETDANGVARMTKQDGITLPAGETVTLQPGGLHVMFMGLGGTAFEEGDKINATLVFEQAGKLDVVFNVEARSADDHKGMDHSGHKMSD